SELTAEDYSEAQQAAWMASAGDEEAFGERLAGELTLVATIDGEAVGFAALKGKDEVDMLYVHPAVAGQGIGAQLMDALERYAAARSLRPMPATPRLASSSAAAMSRSSAIRWCATTNGSPTPPCRKPCRLRSGARREPEHVRVW